MAKKSWLGILAIVLVLGMTVVGCEEPPTHWDVTIGNNTDYYTITKIMIWGDGGTDITETLSLTKGQSKTWSLPVGDHKCTVEVGNYTGSHSDLPLKTDGLSQYKLHLFANAGSPYLSRFLKEEVQEEDNMHGDTMIKAKGRYLTLGSL